MPTRTGRQHDAFSLIELIIVLVIMATVTAIALPRYARSLDRYRADAAAQRIVADIARAQSRARSTSASVTITFDTNAETYSIPQVPSPQDPNAGLVVTVGAEPYYADLTSATFSGDAVLVFDGYGAPDSGGTVTVTRGPLSRTVTVDGESGKATVP